MYQGVTGQELCSIGKGKALAKRWQRQGVGKVKALAKARRWQRQGVDKGKVFAKAKTLAEAKRPIRSQFKIELQFSRGPSAAASVTSRQLKCQKLTGPSSKNEFAFNIYFLTTLNPGDSGSRRTETTTTTTTTCAFFFSCPSVLLPYMFSARNLFISCRL